MTFRVQAEPLNAEELKVRIYNLQLNVTYSQLIRSV